MSSTEAVSLLQLNRKVKEGVKQLFPEPFWVIAEISEAKVNRNGHCYLDLIEKESGSDAIVARMRATIWSFTFRVLKPYFESTTGYALGEGLRILVKVTAEFSELYGLSLDIRDIDPSFTIGEIEVKKQKIVQKLIDDGIFELNRQLTLAEVPQFVAVISSPTAAGLQDFLTHLQANRRGYSFGVRLFPAFMQGERTSESVIAALDSIYNSSIPFDVVVIVRGGGAQAELDSFNSYPVGTHICQFPIPVLTGIGHDKDETVADMVAWQNFKTPTAVADFLVDQMELFENGLYGACEELRDIVNEKFSTNYQQLRLLGTSVRKLIQKWYDRISKVIIAQERTLEGMATLCLQKLDKRCMALTGSLRQCVLSSGSRQQYLLRYLGMAIRAIGQKTLVQTEASLKRIEGDLTTANPEEVLSKGYALVFAEGKRIRSINGLKPGDRIVNILSDGQIAGKIEEVAKNNPEKI